VGGLEFFGVLGIFIIIAVWYVQNERSGGGGAKGLLALVQDSAEALAGANKKSYRMKLRTACRSHEVRDVRGLKERAAHAAPSYRSLDADDGRKRRAYKSIANARHDNTAAGRYKSLPGPAAA